MNDRNEPGDQASALGNAVFPIQLMFESDGLFYYSAHCCQTGEDSHWGVLTSSSDSLVTGCSGNVVPGTLLEGTWEMVADPKDLEDYVQSVFLCDDVTSKLPFTNIELVNATAEKLKGEFRLTPGIVNPPETLEAFCRDLSNTMFDLYRIDYEFIGGSCPPGTKFLFMFACNPRDVSGRPQDLPIGGVAAVPNILAYCRAIGCDSEQLIVSL